jgi:hypothetical protein
MLRNVNMHVHCPNHGRLDVQEAGVMASMRHPHIVPFMGVCTAPPAIVTEYCERGSLTALLQGAKALPDRAAELTWRFRIKMVRSQRGRDAASVHGPSYIGSTQQLKATLGMEFNPGARGRRLHAHALTLTSVLRCRCWALPAACCTSTTAAPPSSTATSRAPTSWWMKPGGSRWAGVTTCPALLIRTPTACCIASPGGGLQCFKVWLAARCCFQH